MPLLSSHAAHVVFFIVLLAWLSFMGLGTSHPTIRKQPYIVQMDSTRVSALDRSLGGSKRWIEAVLEALIHLASPDQEQEPIDPPELLYVYETVLTGFAAKLSADHLKSLPNLDGFLFVYPDEISTGLHTTYSPQFIGLTPDEGLWNPTNLASDVIVGVVDTGIWPEHVSFADSHGISGVPSRWKGACEAGVKFSSEHCNKKLIGARAFWKGYEAVGGVINETKEFRSARDSQGHGTHTASTAAGNVVAGASLFGNANGTAKGIRYSARVAAYKACWGSGCASSDILAAVDQAVIDGVDILSISIGGSSSQPYYSDSIAIATFAATQKGVFVSCSAGNSGPSESTVTNTAPWITTVAASYLDRSFPTLVKLGDGRTFKGASLYSGRNTRQLPVVYGVGGREGERFCVQGGLSPKMVKGKIVICERGINGRTEKGEQVRIAGGAGMLLLNSGAAGEELFADPHVLPATTLGAVASTAIKGYVLSSKNPTASIAFRGTVFGDPAPMMAAFSSRGPSAVASDIIKPDVTAPGMSILAAWPPSISPSLVASDRRRVPFNIISGTSMSCPHVSGLAALLKSAHRNWSPAAIKSALMTTAYTLNNRNATITDVATGLPANPFAMGSGHVDPDRASNPGLIYDIAPNEYLDYLCSLNYTSGQISALASKNYSCQRVGFRHGDLNYPSFSVAFDIQGKGKRAMRTRTVTNVGPARCKYTVRFVEPKGASMSVAPRVLEFVRVGQKLSYKVWFASRGGSGSAFGELIWSWEGFSVRSPVAVTWQ